MNLTVTWQWVLALIVAIGGPAVGLWWIFVRGARPPTQHVSAAWRDEHVRDRRESTRE